MYLLLIYNPCVFTETVFSFFYLLFCSLSYFPVWLRLHSTTFEPSFLCQFWPTRRKPWSSAIMSSNSTSNDSSSSDNFDSTTAGFLYAVAIGTIVGTILLLVFCVLRTRVPEVFQLRSLLNTWKSCDDFNGIRVGVTQPRPTDSFFGWIRPVFVTSEDEVVRKIGLDAAMFLRSIRTFFFIMAIISVFGAILLMPVYATDDGDKTKTPDAGKGLEKISVSNVSDQSKRFWATAIAEFFIAAVTIYFLASDYSHYASLRRRYRLSETPVNYSLIVYDIPEEDRKEETIRSRFEQMVPGQVTSVIVMRDPKTALKLQKKLDAAVAKREVAEYVCSTKGIEPETRPGFCGALLCKPKVDAIRYWSSEQDRLADEIHDLGASAPTTPSAIVVLSNKRAAAVLREVNSSTNALNWHVECAPEPDAINWSAFSVPGYQVEVRSIMVATFIFFFTLFWTIPAAAIAGLANLTKLSETVAFSWARPLLDISPAVVGLIEGLLPPVVMSVIVSLIPTLFRFVVSQERLASLSKIEVKTRDYFYMFTIYGTFFAFVIGSSFFQDLNGLRKNFVLIIDLLATKVPGTGVYFATFIILQCLIPFPLALCGIVRVIVRAIFLKLAKTDRQKRKAKLSGSLFQFFRFSGAAMMILYLGLVFSSLAPLVPLCATVYFALAYITYRYQLLFSTYQEWEGGGELFPGLYWGTMMGLILKQLVVVATLGLKKAPGPSIVCLVPAIVTICLTGIIHKRFSGIAENGSFLDLCTEPSKIDEVPRRYRMVYEQPAGKGTTYENLNGIGKPRDVYSEVEYYDGERNDAVHSETLDDSVGYVPDPAANREEV